MFDLSGIRYVLYESKGDLTIVAEGAGPVPQLVRGLGEAVGWVEPPGGPGQTS